MLEIAPEFEEEVVSTTYKGRLNEIAALCALITRILLYLPPRLSDPAQAADTIFIDPSLGG